MTTAVVPAVPIPDITELPAIAPNREMSQGQFSPAMDDFLAPLPSFRDTLQAAKEAIQVNVEGVAANAALVENVSINVLNSPVTIATSTTTNTLGTGDKTWAIPTDKVFGNGQFVVVYSTAGTILGQVKDFTAGSVTIDCQSFTGAGSSSAWTISLQGVTLRQVRQEMIREAKTAAYTATATDCAKLLDVSGVWALGVADAATLGNGWYVDLKNGGTGVITIDPFGSQTVAGASARLVRPGEKLRLFYKSDTELDLIQLEQAVGVKVRSDGPPGQGWLPRSIQGFSQAAYPGLFEVLGHKNARFGSVSGPANYAFSVGGSNYYTHQDVAGRYTSAYSSGSTFGLSFWGASSAAFNIAAVPVVPTTVPIGVSANISNPLLSQSPTTKFLASSVGNALIVIDATSPVHGAAISNLVVSSGISNAGLRTAFGFGKIMFRVGTALYYCDDGTMSGLSTNTSAFSSAETGNAASLTALGVVYSPLANLALSGNYGTTTGYKSATPTVGAWTQFAFPVAMRDMAVLSDGTIIMIGMDYSVWVSPDVVDWTYIGNIPNQNAYRILPQKGGMFAIVGPATMGDSGLVIGNKYGLCVDFEYSSYQASEEARPFATASFTDGSSNSWQLVHVCPMWDDVGKKWVSSAYNTTNTQFRPVLLSCAEANLSTHFVTGRKRSRGPTSTVLDSPPEYIKAL